jgi:hypothetical protein
MWLCFYCSNCTIEYGCPMHVDKKWLKVDDLHHCENVWRYLMKYNNKKKNVEFSFLKLIKYLIMDCQIGQGITKLTCCTLPSI